MRFSKIHVSPNYSLGCVTWEEADIIYFGVGLNVLLVFIPVSVGILDLFSAQHTAKIYNYSQWALHFAHQSDTLVFVCRHRYHVVFSTDTDQVVQSLSLL